MWFKAINTVYYPGVSKSKENSKATTEQIYALCIPQLHLE